MLSIAGDLATVPIGAILQMLQVECKTGVLVVSSGQSGARAESARGPRDARPSSAISSSRASEVTITMRSGLIDLVQSRGAGDEFRLGRFFIEEGLVTPAEIEALLRDPRSASSRAGEPSSLSDPPTSDRISTTPSPPLIPGSAETAAAKPRMLVGDALAALARQSSELIYEVLRWPKGWFEFRLTLPPLLALKAKLGLPVASVVMEGFRRVDEWRLVEQGLGSFDAVLVRDPVALDTFPLAELARPERIVLDAIDGVRTVRDIIATSHMSSFDACRVLLQFLEARVVRRRPS
jgi:hypothetical protein